MCAPKYYGIFFLIVTLILPITSFGLDFELPKADYGLVGEVKTTQVQPEDETYSSICERLDVGPYELLEANPNINPDDPPVGAILIVPTQYILPAELKRNIIVINLAEMRLYFLPKQGNKVYIFPVSIGKEDWVTPVTQTTVIEKIRNPSWTIPKSLLEFRASIGLKDKKTVINPGPDNPLGKFKLRLANPSFLIHGTNLPEGVGRRTTAGCIRLYEKDIEQLFNLVEVGTKVITINKPYKTIFFNNKLYLEAHMPLFEQRVDMEDSAAIKIVFDSITMTLRNKNITSKNITVDWAKAAKITKEHLVMPREIELK